MSHAFDPHFRTSSTSQLYFLPPFTLNFLVSRTLPNSITSLLNFSSESATSAVSSANNSWFISNLPPFTSTVPALSQAPLHSPLAPHHANIYHTTMKTSSQPCLKPTLTGNYPLTSIPTRTHAILSPRNSAPLSTIYLQLHTLLATVTCRADRLYHMPIQKSINAQNTYFTFTRHFSHTFLTAYTWFMHPLQ